MLNVTNFVFFFTDGHLVSYYGKLKLEVRLPPPPSFPVALSS